MRQIDLVNSGSRQIVRCATIQPKISQFFDQIEECEWAIEVCAEFGLPIAATMTVGPMGDLGNVSAADCAVRMAKGLFLYI